MWMLRFKWNLVVKKNFYRGIYRLLVFLFVYIDILNLLIIKIRKVFGLVFVKVLVVNIFKNDIFYY